jgi:hypothetical protein
MLTTYRVMYFSLERIICSQPVAAIPKSCVGRFRFHFIRVIETLPVNIQTFFGSHIEVFAHMKHVHMILKVWIIVSNVSCWKCEDAALQK